MIKGLKKSPVERARVTLGMDIALERRVAVDARAPSNREGSIGARVYVERDVVRDARARDALTRDDRVLFPLSRDVDDAFDAHSTTRIRRAREGERPRRGRLEGGGGVGAS